MKDKAYSIVQDWRLGEATVSSIMRNYPKPCPDNTLAQAIGTDNSIVEESGMLHPRQGETVPQYEQKDGRVREVAQEIEKGPEK